MAMKLKTSGAMKAPVKKTTTKGTSRKSTLPSDEYKEEFDPIEIEVDETRKIVVSVKRDSTTSLPMLDIREYVMTEKYTGYTKKGIRVPVDMTLDLLDVLEEVNKNCEEKDLYGEEFVDIEE